MKTVVFGATGTVGRLAVEQMLAAGHHVTAFARRPQELELRHDALTRIAGDATDPAAVSQAVRGQDAVVITIGAGMQRASKVRSQATRAIIAAMHEHGVRRLICQSTLGAHESRGNLDFFWKRIMFGLLLAPVLRDHEVQEDLVRESGLDWTIVRPSAFADGPSGGYREDFPANDRKLRLKIARTDVAGFLKRQLTDRTYLHRAVGIST